MIFCLIEASQGASCQIKREKRTNSGQKKKKVIGKNGGNARRGETIYAPFNLKSRKEGGEAAVNKGEVTPSE